MKPAAVTTTLITVVAGLAATLHTRPSHTDTTYATYAAKPATWTSEPVPQPSTTTTVFVFEEQNLGPAKPEWLPTHINAPTHVLPGSVHRITGTCPVEGEDYSMDGGISLYANPNTLGTPVLQASSSLEFPQSFRTKPFEAFLRIADPAGTDLYLSILCKPEPLYVPFAGYYTYPLEKVVRVRVVAELPAVTLPPSL